MYEAYLQSPEGWGPYQKTFLGSRMDIFLEQQHTVHVLSPPSYSWVHACKRIKGANF